MGVLYFVPHFFLYVLIPLLGIGYILYHGNGENARGLVFFDIQKFIPFLSVWWILFGLDDYVEGNSSEILRVYKRALLSEFWLMFGWYILHVTLLFLILRIFLESYWMDLPLIIIQCSAFASWNTVIFQTQNYHTGSIAGALENSYALCPANYNLCAGSPYLVSGLKLLSVNGISPTRESIDSGKYPLIYRYYAVIRADEPADSPARKLAKWLQSEEGKELVSKAMG